jgi:hypothetical protein
VVPASAGAPSFPANNRNIATKIAV